MKWNEIYAPPFEDMYKVLDDRSGRIKDANGNFVFQFLTSNPDGQDAILRIINGEEVAKKGGRFHHSEGRVRIGEKGKAGGRDVLRIRGWGNLTGIGSHNMSTEDALEVQGTFAEYIVSMLNREEL